jgi:NADPH:quinone reductase-like Zn-dependent oxidoreductase
MKAVVLHEYGPPSKLIYEDFADPTPARGEVLVRVHAVSVTPSIGRCVPEPPRNVSR